jgi:tetratricopeptide (TPR) repeat protein
MKKKLILTVLTLFIAPIMWAQTPVCVTDAWTYLRNEKPFAAKKKIDDCLPGNMQNADVWLMRGNVYFRLYEYETTYVEKGEKTGKPYTRTYADAIDTANKSFLKAMELNNNVQPQSGMYGPKDGQIACGGPMYDMGAKARAEKKYEKAYNYFLAAAKDWELTKNTASYDKDLIGFVYLDVAEMAKLLHRDADYKKHTLTAVRTNTKDEMPYLWMYDIYRQENDTANCAKMINLCLKNVPSKGQKNANGYLLDYYGMIGDIAKMTEVADSIIIKYSDTVTVVAMVAGHLVNHRQYEKTENILNKALAIAPDNFDLNYQMGFRFYSEALDHKEAADKFYSASNMNAAQKEQSAQTECMKKSYPWILKAYQIKNDDMQTNRMLYTMCLILRETPPEGLKEKIDSYIEN